MAFYVGQKVVCVEGGKANEPPPRAVTGAIYTISEVFRLGPYTMLQFVEMRYGGEFGWLPGFAAEYFRPITERKTDISIFKAMLNPSKQEVTA